MAPSLLFTVRRREPVLVAPAKPTPHEMKLLSDIDDQKGLRFQIPGIQFYRYDPSMAGKDPVEVIRKALANTLVFYYPFAGRLRERASRKLMVDCTGEGVLFIEADADVTLNQFGDALQPPFSYLEELLYNVPGSEGILNTPLLLIQVTRLKCGGFIYTQRVNHTMSDAAGLSLFMTALSEIARGMHEPSIPPVWRRELLNARDPPRVTCTHREYEQVPDTKGTIIPLDDMAHRSFFFGPKEHDSDEEVRLICVVNARAKFDPPLPSGYYGNAFALPVAVTTAGKLCENQLGYVLELVRKAKADVTEEYMHSMADLMVTKGRPHFTVRRSYLLTDVTRAGFGEVDFGWGKPVYGGPADEGGIPGLASYYLRSKNAKGEEGIVIPVCLLSDAMERFIKELDDILNNHVQPAKGGFIVSSL
ncbi:Transferase [Sesbania bispinosa]|nr:Transferase [Sesbania bispinosa]